MSLLPYQLSSIPSTPPQSRLQYTTSVALLPLHLTHISGTPPVSYLVRLLSQLNDINPLSPYCKWLICSAVLLIYTACTCHPHPCTILHLPPWTCHSLHLPSKNFSFILSTTQAWCYTLLALHKHILYCTCHPQTCTLALALHRQFLYWTCPP